VVKATWLQYIRGISYREPYRKKKKKIKINDAHRFSVAGCLIGKNR